VHVLEMFSLKGRVALVTGGAGQLGRQMVAALAEAGARTYAASRDLDNLRALANVCAARRLDVRAVRYDQGDESSILSLHRHIIQESGRLDVLVNNAVSRIGLFAGHRIDAATFDEDMRINVRGLFLITRAFAESMAERGEGGSIINVASIHGMVGMDRSLYEGTSTAGDKPTYYFQKGGMINFTRYIAAYYGPKGIRCNSISPGGYSEEGDQEHIARYRTRTFLGRRLNDTDLKGVVVFLASDASLYVTGVNIPVDGGYTAM